MKTILMKLLMKSKNLNLLVSEKLQKLSSISWILYLVSDNEADNIDNIAYARCFNSRWFQIFLYCMMYDAHI